MTLEAAMESIASFLTKIFTVHCGERARFNNYKPKFEVWWNQNNPSMYLSKSSVHLRAFGARKTFMH
jgi:hypothetical protein